MSRAKELAWEAYNYSIQTKQEPDIANSLLSLARVYYDAGNIDSSKIFLFNSQKIKNEIEDISGLDRIYFYWGMILQKDGKYREAIKKYQIALQYARLSSKTTLQARCYTELANCYKFLNESAKMNQSIEAALLTLKKGGDSLLLSNAYCHLGILQNDLGQLENAVSSFIQSIRIAEVLCDSLGLGYLCSNLAGVYGAFALPEKANEYNLKAYNVFKNTGNKRGMAYALNSLGITASGLKENSKALKYYLEAGQLKVAVADWQGACFIYNNIADLYINTKELTLAGKYLKIAEYFTGKAGDMLSTVVFYNTSGHYHSARYEHSIARSFFEKSLYLAETAKLHDFITSNLESISAEYDAEGKPGEALAFFKRYTARKDSVASLNDRKAIAEMQVKYDSDRKESQLKEMSRLILNSSLENRSFLAGNITIGLMILLISVLFLYRMKSKMRLASQASGAVHSDFPGLDLKKITFITDQASKPTLTPDQQQWIWSELNQIMDKEKLFLNGNLKLSDLALRLNTNTSYLSRVINEMSRENFCNYLNQLRIREAQLLLSDPDNLYLTIEGIALSVGFNSKSAFNTSFKKYTSKTPSEYLNKVPSKDRKPVSNPN
ncbi:MAG: helix-turn-helix transcriptional regulator [Bacteroidales bacterium]|nr:helix-turn-helix transcriptional regulator [Bacteroidales bacterium]